MKPQTGQRWRFINYIENYDYVAEIYCLEPLCIKVIQIVSSGRDNDLSYRLYQIVEMGSESCLELSGPIDDDDCEWIYLEGQEAPI